MEHEFIESTRSAAQWIGLLLWEAVLLVLSAGAVGCGVGLTAEFIQILRKITW